MTPISNFMKIHLVRDKLTLNLLAPTTVGARIKL